MINRMACMTGLRKMEMRTIGMPHAAPDQVVVKLEYVGICGSDVHYYEHGKIGDFVVQGDFILGHECAGTVVEVGSNVAHLRVGDRVALEPGLTCGKCEYCKTGKYNLCPDVRFLATPPIDGCLVDYLAYPADMAFKLPDQVSSLEGALVEPLSVGLHAAVQGQVTLGSRVIILGSGPIGLMTIQGCKAYGATEIIAVDIFDNRLEYAKRLGATKVIHARRHNVIDTVMEWTNGRGLDVVFETAGSEATIQDTPHLVSRGGTIVLVGLAGKDIIPYHFMQIMSKEASIKSVFRYRNLFPTAIEAIADGRINVKDMVTHEFDFTDSHRAFEYVIEHKQEVVKAIIKM